MNEELNEKIAEVKESVEEKKAEITEKAEELGEKVSEHLQEAAQQAEEAREKLHQSLEDLNETLKNDAGEKVADASSGVQLTLKPNEAYQKARQEVKEKYGTDKKQTELKDQVSDKFAKARKEVSETFGDLKETAMGVGAKIGEKSREAAEKFKDSGTGKALLGDDGKFDLDDVGRIGSGILEAGEKAVDKVAGIIRDLTDKK
jgi:hypothetical protein